MTRQEEIIEAARSRAERHQIAEMKVYGGDKYNYSYGRIYNSEMASFEAGAEWADKHPAKKQAVTIEAWVARNKHIDADSNTDLVLGKERPTFCHDMWCSMEEYYPLPKDALPEVTFENSPKKVKVTIEMDD